MKLVIEPMALADLQAVHEIERESFATPWPPHAYQTEIETNRLARYVVARIDGEIVAFAGTWLMVDELHVTTFAVAPVWRRRGIGERMLMGLLRMAVVSGANDATLEVRISNIAARRLYEKFGFKPVGVRPRYYSDNNEDALIMTTDPLEDPMMVRRLGKLQRELDALDEDDGVEEVVTIPEGPPVSRGWRRRPSRRRAEGAGSDGGPAFGGGAS